MDDLKVIRQEPYSGLVSRLEKLLAAAKKGEIQAIVYVKMYPNGSTAHGWSIPAHKTKGIPALLGGAQIMSTDLANDLNGIEARIIRDG